MADSEGKADPMVVSKSSSELEGQAGASAMQRSPARHADPVHTNAGKAPKCTRRSSPPPLGSPGRQGSAFSLAGAAGPHAEEPRAKRAVHVEAAGPPQQSPDFPARTLSLPGSQGHDTGAYAAHGPAPRVLGTVSKTGGHVFAAFAAPHEPRALPGAPLVAVTPQPEPPVFGVVVSAPHPLLPRTGSFVSEQGTSPRTDSRRLAQPTAPRVHARVRSGVPISISISISNRAPTLGTPSNPGAWARRRGPRSPQTTHQHQPQRRTR
jgi:hypothetical protein